MLLLCVSPFQDGDMYVMKVGCAGGHIAEGQMTCQDPLAPSSRLSGEDGGVSWDTDSVRPAILALEDIPRS